MNLFSAILLILGIITFMVGIHSIDNAWNLVYVNKITGDEFIDQNMFGGQFTPNMLYNQGVQMCFAGFIMSLLGAITIDKEFKKKAKIPDDAWNI